MKYKKHIIMSFIITLLLIITNLTAVKANSAEPPGFTVIVLNAPRELSMLIQTPELNESSGILLIKQKKGWESYYKFFYSKNFKLINGTKLIVKSEGKTFECQLPLELFERYNNILTLDMETESLTFGQPPFRTSILVAMRVILTLFIEGGIFYLFGYRKRISWILFLVINIITQGGLNLMLTGPSLGSYWIIGYFFSEVIIMVLELVLFTLLLNEAKKSRASLFVIVANLVSLILGGIIISFLPV